MHDDDYKHLQTVEGTVTPVGLGYRILILCFVAEDRGKLRDLVVSFIEQSMGLNSLQTEAVMAQLEAYFSQPLCNNGDAILSHSVTAPSTVFARIYGDERTKIASPPAYATQVHSIRVLTEDNKCLQTEFPTGEVYISLVRN